MRRSILLMTCILFLCPGCLVMDTDCCEYIITREISKGLYVERYRTFCAGVFGERIDHFLTDSLRFRANVGWSDEHYSLLTAHTGDSIFTYKVESSFGYDTLHTKSLSKYELKKFNHLSSPTKTSIPLFGTNPLNCNNVNSFSSYELEEIHDLDKKYFFASYQFRCGNKFINADYLTDSSSFQVLIGFYDVGRGPFYSVNIKGDTIHFYEKQDRTLLDTVEVKHFKLSEIVKDGYEKPCKK